MTHIFVLVGASGVGKTTVAKAVVRLSKNLIMPVGVTTREPRKGEKQGVDYRFVSLRQFQQWKQENAFIETIQYRDATYGFLKKDIIDPQSQGFYLLLILTREGLEVFENLFGNQVVSIFLAPPSEEELAQRLWKRGVFWKPYK